MNLEESLDKETTKLGAILDKALDQHNQRMILEYQSGDVFESGKAIPESIHNFTKMYLDGLKNILKR